MGIIAYRFFLAIVTMELLRRLRVVSVQIKGKPIKVLAVVALFQPILYFLLETTGIQYVSSSEAGMMIALIPIVVAVASPFSLSVSGVLFINWMKSSVGDEVSFLGISLIFLAVVSAAMFNIFSRRAREYYQPADITYMMMLTDLTWSCDNSSIVVFGGYSFSRRVLFGQHEFIETSRPCIKCLCQHRYDCCCDCRSGIFIRSDIVVSLGGSGYDCNRGVWHQPIPQKERLRC